MNQQLVKKYGLKVRIDLIVKVKKCFTSIL